MLSRKVYLYDGASHAKAEAGFAESGAVYINKNAPVNRNTVAVVLAHEYVHTTEGTDAYTNLADAVFKSKSYNEMLRSRGMTQNEYLNSIVDSYEKGGVALSRRGDPMIAAKSEAVAMFLSEYVLQDVNVLIDLARTDRNTFQRLYTQIRRFIARLNAKSASRQGLYKLERMFAKAAKVSNTATQTQKSPTTTSGAQYMAYIGETKDGRRCYESGFDSSVSMDVRVAEFKKKISTIFNLGAVELKTDVKKIKIKADKFTNQKNLYGAQYESVDEYTSKINSLFDLADILSTATYDPNATQKEQSYANSAIKPKNDAHKGVKYWYKFRNEIVFDGVPFTVTFNIRDKGTEQYQYLIEFKENKALGISNTVAKSNLLRTRQAPYKPIIHDPSQKSNTNFSQPDPVTDAVFEEAPATDEPATPTTQWSFPVTPSNSQPVSGSMTERVVGDVEKSGVGGVDVEKRYRLIAEQTQAAVSAKQEDVADDSPFLEELMDAFKAGMDGQPYTPKSQQPPSDVDTAQAQEYNDGETIDASAEEHPLSDEEQFDQYAHVLQELAPSSFEEFQTIRNTDPERFKELENQYHVVSQYKIDSGSLSATEIWNLDQRTYDEKRRSFSKRYARSGNIAGAYLDGDIGKMYFAHSQVNDAEGVSKYYSGQNQFVILKNNRRFQYIDVRKANGEGRTNTFYDTEAKLFEYFADLYEEKPFKSITLLSERGMCDSCKGVMEQFKKQFPDVTVNVVSNKSVEGNVWKRRRRR